MIKIGVKTGNYDLFLKIGATEFSGGLPRTRKALFRNDLRSQWGYPRSK